MKTVFFLTSDLALCCRQIEELTQYINKAELKINEILDENEELRYRLGMDPRAPLDLTEFRKNKAIRQEEEKALNFILQRQVCECSIMGFISGTVLMMSKNRGKKITGNCILCSPWLLTFCI